MAVRACVFDAYGTLFDVAAAARNAAAQPGGERLAQTWEALAETWRVKQLEYSWLRGLAGDYAPFRQVTADALDVAMAAHGIEDAGLRETLIGLYDRLDAYDEVGEVLTRLRGAGMATAILSNGSPDMLDAAVSSAGLGDALDAVLSVAEVETFKPHPSVYRLVERRMGVPPGETAFFSSNCWDATAAQAFGFRTVWVNRRGAPLDRVGAEPWRTVGDLREAAAVLGGA